MFSPCKNNSHLNVFLSLAKPLVFQMTSYQVFLLSKSVNPPHTACTCNEVLMTYPGHQFQLLNMQIRLASQIH